jgi:hypothetical protein
LEDQEGDVKTALKWILGRKVVRMGCGSDWLRVM